MSVSIREVAQQAGVSISTVSRVLNNTCSVNEDKRRRVLKIAEELGYTPNPAARSLLGKKTGGLGVVLPFVGAEFFSEFLTGLDQEAQHAGYFLAVSTSHRHPDEFESAMQAMQHRVDGMIVMAPELADEDAGAIIRAPGRILFVNTYISSERVNVLNFDNYGGARALTKHLLDLGHRRIALIRGPAGAHDARERARGYRDAMKDAGLTPLADLEYAGDYTQEAGYRAAETILQSDLLPTAIVAANDYCAMGALQALSEAGIAVPKQMALTGFDGITSGRYTQPAITTALVPIRDIGRQAVRRLLNILDGNGEAEHVIVPVDIVTRASTCESEAEFAARDAG